jgi:hypothetical protein
VYKYPGYVLRRLLPPFNIFKADNSLIASGIRDNLLWEKSKISKLQEKQEKLDYN